MQDKRNDGRRKLRKYNTIQYNIILLSKLSGRNLNKVESYRR